MRNQTFLSLLRGDIHHLPIQRLLGITVLVAATLYLGGCAHKKTGKSTEASPTSQSIDRAAVDISFPVAQTVVPDISPIWRAKSRWIPVAWSDLPGLEADSVGEAWPALQRSCTRPGPIFAPICQEATSLAYADDATKRRWLMQRLQPYQVQSHNGNPHGLLTSYYEPVMQANRVAGGVWRYPLYAVPAGGAPRGAWLTRRQIESSNALAGRELLYLSDPIDAMILHVQGSGRVQVHEADGRQRMVRMAFAGTNNQPFRGPSAWITARGGTGGSWAAVRAWAARNPSRVQEMLWSNPRYVFFQEQTMSTADEAMGPRGAQGVPLTPGRSIAVDKDSIPYGALVWLSSTGAAAQLNRLVVAQDTGSAIKGAVRADYFAGWSPDAAHLAHAMKQPLHLWVLWPR